MSIGERVYAFVTILFLVVCLLIVWVPSTIFIHWVSSSMRDGLFPRSYVLLVFLTLAMIGPYTYGCGNAIGSLLKNHVFTSRRWTGGRVV